MRCPYTITTSFTKILMLSAIQASCTVQKTSNLGYIYFDAETVKSVSRSYRLTRDGFT